MHPDKEAAQALGARCDECPLASSGVYVPSEGPADAKIAFVGEGPGIQEAKEGRPFIGPSGRLLNKVNDQYGIKREDSFFTNAALCRPPDGSTPPKSAIVSCRPRLIRELSQTDTVVALGNSAALGVLGQEGITKLRVGPGKDSPFEGLEDKRIIPTVHPAACLRQSDMFPSLVADIGKIFLPNREWVEPDYEVLDTLDAKKRLRQLINNDIPIVVDIEVDIEKDTAFDHPNHYGLLCVGLATDEESAFVLSESACGDEVVRDLLKQVLATNRIVAQNGKFDLAGLYPVVGKQELWFDTMLASYCIDERPGVHGLKHMAVEYLGAPQYDAEIKKYVGPKDGYGVIPRPLLYKYNAYDAICTYKLFTMFEKVLDNADLRGMHDFLVEASNALIFVELNGIAIDSEYIQQLTEQYLASLEVIEEELNSGIVAYGYNPINPRSPKQVKEALAHLKVKVESTNEETLTTIIETLEARNDYKHPAYAFCTTLLKHRRESKLYGTYVKGTAKRAYRGRVYPTFLLHGTTTGRLACRNPNLQNVPRESSIRRLFVPGKEGNVFVQADYSQAELRVLTWLSGDEYFRDILNDPNRDLFDELTPILYPNAGTKDSMSDAAWKELRIRVKAFVYGLGYGRTEFSIAREYKLSVDEAKAVKNRFFETIPAIVQWQKDIKNQVWNGKDLVTAFGRHRRFHLITDENWKSVQNEAMAFLPQSTSSDICLRAMVRVRRDLIGTGAYSDPRYAARIHHGNVRRYRHIWWRGYTC
jgi:DNA polymerase-1